MGSGKARPVQPAVPRPATARPFVSSRTSLARPLVQPRRSTPPKPGSEPTVLVIGADDAFIPALRLALARHHIYVESSLMTRAVETVVVTAPDLVLLVGEAARDSGRKVLTELAASPVSSVVPVAILGDETLDVRLRAFRYGAAAVIPRSASVDAIAEHIARLAREIPERGEVLGNVGEATLSEFVETLKNELRTGILSVQSSDSDAPVRLVLGSGRPLAAFIDDFVRRVRKHVVHAEPLRYEFDDRAPGTVQLLANESRDSEPPPGSIEGLRVMLADNQPARVDVVAQELRARGATVVVSDFEPDSSQFRRLRQFDPQVLMIGEAEIEGPGYGLFSRMKGDTRLRWASLLVVRWHEIWENALAVPAVDRIGGALAALAEPDRGLFDRCELGDAFDARLEVTGPARCLRALAHCKRPLRVSVHNARVAVDVDLSDGLVVGVTARAVSGERWEGASALAALLVLATGRVHVEPIQQPATTNIMATVDVALDLAESEPVPLVPSITPAALTPGAASAAAAQEPARASGPNDVAAPAAPAVAVSRVVDVSGGTGAGFVDAPGPPGPVAAPLEAPAFAAPRSSEAMSVPIEPGRTSRDVSAWLTELWRKAQPWTDRLRRLGEAKFVRGVGVSRPVAAVLLAVAVFWGLVIAFGLRQFIRFALAPAATAAASAAPSAPAATAAPRATASELGAAPAAPSEPAPTPTPSEPAAASETAPPSPPSSASAAAPVPAAPVAPSAPGVDESGVRAPSCDDLIGSGVPSGGDVPGAVLEQLKRARRAIVQGDTDEAQRRYCTIVRWDADNANHYFELAQLMLLRRDGAAAAEWARQGLERDPTSTRGHSLLGDSLARIGDGDGAKRAWFAAANVSAPGPEDEKELIHRSLKEAEQALGRRDFARAERFFRRAVILDPANVAACIGLSTSFLRRGERELAMQWANRAGELAPREPRAQLAMGDAAFAVGERERAKRHYLEAIALGYGDARRRLRRFE